MKIYTKKIIAMLCLALLCLPLLISCAADEEVPKDMQAAYVKGEPFRLYVPKEMTVNTTSGISSAFSYVPDKLVISARYYTPSDKEMTLQEYIDYCKKGYADSVKEFSIKSEEAAVLSGVDAINLTYTSKTDGIDYTCTQISAYYNGDFVSLNLYVPTSVLESHKQMADMVIKEFVLCEKAETVNDNVTDKHTPSGMKIASSDNLEYRLYVPETWICSAESGKSEAYYPESEKSNVTLTSFSPDGEMSAKEYAEKCKEEYAKELKGYELTEESEKDVAGKKGVSLTYKSSYDGIDFKINQVIFTYGNIVYNFTYTATESNFDLHLEDVEAMLDVFTFR